MKFLLFITLLFSISAFSFAGTVGIDQDFKVTDNEIGGGSSNVITGRTEDNEFSLNVTGEITQNQEKNLSVVADTGAYGSLPNEVGWRSINTI